jgi:hypothetical protein
MKPFGFNMLRECKEKFPKLPPNYKHTPQATEEDVLDEKV